MIERTILMPFTSYVRINVLIYQVHCKEYKYIDKLSTDCMMGKYVNFKCNFNSIQVLFL